MDKVYIITAGTYSDEHIVAVFTEQAEAEQFRDTYNSRIMYLSRECRIEEYPIGADMSLAGKDLYCARAIHHDEMDAWWMCEEALNRADEIGIVKEENGCLECFVAVPMNQDDPEEYARKVAADLFAEYKARKEGIT
jgi:hypothetical protein